ncbi:HEAT repeat protein [Cooperia oncophora]
MFHMICSVSDTQFPVVVKENKDGSKQPLIITPELRRSAERPAGLAVAALKTLLSRTMSTAVIEDMNQARGWTECLDRELFIGAITVLVRSLVEHRPEWVDSLARSVMEKSSHEREPMRLAAVIVSSALVKKSPDSNGDFNEKLLIDSVRLLENSLTDQSLRIRKFISLFSYASVAWVSYRNAHRNRSRNGFASIAVEAAMGGLDDLGDKNDTVAMESIVALNKLVSKTNDAQLHSILRQVLLKIRPCFEKESAPLRAASFSLFGELAARIGGENEEFMSHLHANIVALLLHLNDEDENVRKQETVVREAMLETMRLIAISIHPSRLPGDYRFDARNELIGYIKDYVQSETPEMLSSSLRLLAAKATAALVRLEPALSDDDVWDLGCVLTQYILPMCREKSGLKTLAYDLFDYASTSISSFTSSSSRASTKKIDDDESATIMDATVAQYGNALEAIVEMRPTVGTVTQLLKMLLPYYGKLAEHERSRSIDATVQVLRVYLDRAEDISIGIASDFGPLSSLLARLTPRLVDSLALVRHQSLVAIHYAFRLANAYKGHGTLTDSTLFRIDEFARTYLNNEGRLDVNDAKKAIRKMAEVSGTFLKWFFPVYWLHDLELLVKVIESRLPQCQMQTYLSALFEMLTDRQSQVSSAAAQLLTYALTCRGAVLVHEADTLVTTILARLPEVHSCVQTYTDLMAALVAFATHQQTVVCDVMLRQPLPYSVQLLDAWECLSRERSLFVNTLDYLLELLTGALEHPYDVMDTGGGSSVKIVHVEPCQYTAAITEVIKHGEPEWTLYERVPVLIAAMFHMICSVSDTQFPVVVKENKDGSKQPLIITPELRRSAERPAGLAVAALKTLLSRTMSTAVIEDMNQARGWTECLDRELFIGAITVLVRSLVEHRPEWVDSLARSVMEKSSHEREPMRLAAVIVSSALVKKCPDSNGDFNEKLLIDSVRLLENSLTDQSLRIRKLCVRGLGELSECSSESIAERFASIAVEAAMGGLDDLGDKNDTVAMESIVALNKLVSKTNDAQLHSILRQVLLKIRPCFEKESAPLRAASFSLFGELAARIGGENEEFMSHLHANIVALLLHLNDEDENVRKACSTTFNQVHPLFNVGTFSSVVEREMKGGRLPASYTAVQRDLASVLALSFPDRVNQYALTCSNYFKSSNARIRANAALLTGHMLGVLTPQLRAIISKDLVFSSLVLLLRDPEDVSVRIAAAKAVGSLHDFA